jgi:hypothetical protein
MEIFQELREKRKHRHNNVSFHTVVNAAKMKIPVRLLESKNGNVSTTRNFKLPTRYKLDLQSFGILRSVDR